jgi:hypothetical protein
MERKRLNDLIQADLDGELSVAERADLARLLLRDPEVRSLHDQYRRMDQLLREVPAAEPPAGLQAAVLARRELSPRPGHGHRGWLGQPLYRVAAAVLGGLLIVGLGYVLRDGDMPGAELQGSLGRAGSARSAESVAPQDRLSMRADGVELEASLRGVGQTLRLELNLSTTVPCELVAKIDPARTAWIGHPGEPQLTAASGQVSVAAAPGSRSFVLDFSGVAPIRLQLYAGGRLLGEGELSVGDR